MQMVWTVCMVHRWYIDGMQMVRINRMVLVWYIDGTSKSYGTKREIKNFVPYADGNKKN